MLSLCPSFWSRSTSCNHAEQLQHQGPFQPLLLRDGEGQPWVVVSAVVGGVGAGPVDTVLSLTASIKPSPCDLHSSETLLLCILLHHGRGCRPGYVVAGLPENLVCIVQSIATECRWFFLLQFSLENILHCCCLFVFCSVSQTGAVTLCFSR